VRRLLAGVALAFVALLAVAQPAAADDGAQTWTDVAETMNAILEDAYTAFQSGDLEVARDLVNDAYYGYYEAAGFEKTVMAYLSGQAATDAEFEFTVIKRNILAGGPDADVRSHIDTLQAMLLDQAGRLDGSGSNPVKLFFDALVIILREGVEAILVLGAIIAYLVKAGAQDRLKLVYAGAALAVAASVALAVLLNTVANLAGAPQEIIEGVTILVAMVMLIWVANWIAAKSEAGAWSAYVKDKTGQSLSGRSAVSLAAVAFLAVFREGAEVILLYQALQAGARGSTAPLWAGLGAGALALVAIYVAIRYFSLRIPLRPFFIATSLLLALLAFTFAGNGVKELQEGDVLPLTPVAGPTFDLLGVYPTAETLAAQGIVLAALATGLTLSFRHARAQARQPELETTS
jgi:high-affinity iron transporter